MVAFVTKLLKRHMLEETEYAFVDWSSPNVANKLYNISLRCNIIHVEEVVFPEDFIVKEDIKAEAAHAF